MSGNFGDKHKRLTDLSAQAEAAFRESNLKSDLERAGYGTIDPDIAAGWAAVDSSSPLRDMEHAFARANLEAAMTQNGYKPIDPEMAKAWRDAVAQGISHSPANDIKFDFSQFLIGREIKDK